VSLAVCADVGSTWTKAALVDLDGGKLVATGTHPTTTSEIMTGLSAAVRASSATLQAASIPWYVCSSAGGGLRLAVVGFERLVTAARCSCATPAAWPAPGGGSPWWWPATRTPVTGWRRS
jgi:hypothetical protein